MVRRAAKIDDNQHDIVDRFLSNGLKVVSTAGMANGFPDIIVSHFNGINVLVEIKDGDKIPSKRKLTPDQEEFHATWKGWIEIVENIDDVDALCERIKNSRIAHVAE